MLVLGIETSCDETSVAVVRDGRDVLSNVIASSKAAFEHLAGVIPEEAARKQVECMVPVVRQALEEANVRHSEVDAIAVTRGPGLLGSLLVGTTTARVIASVWNKPLIGIHHTLGHLSSPWLVPKGKEADQPLFPVLTLSASGGHTDLWHRTSHTENRLLGSTKDDAAGEAFDKGASVLSLPYPGGPSIAKAAEGGDPRRYAFPLPFRHDDTLAFSFSGLKTSLKYLIRDDPSALEHLRDLAASFEQAICEQLTDRVKRALTQCDVREVHIVGGVSANTRLRSLAAALCDAHSVKLRTPLTIPFCTDNAAMIASAGFFLRENRGDAHDAPFETSATLPLAALTA